MGNWLTAVTAIKINKIKDSCVLTKYIFYFDIGTYQMIEERMLASPVLMCDSSFTTMFTNTTATYTHDALRI